jgi:hypothetical protein
LISKISVSIRGSSQRLIVTMQPEINTGALSPSGESRIVDDTQLKHAHPATVVGNAAERLDATPLEATDPNPAGPQGSPTAHGKLAHAFKETIAEIAGDINTATSVDYVSVLIDATEMKSALDAEIQTEHRVEQQLELLNALVDHLEKTVLKPAQERYQSATGLLDGNSRLAELSWGISALATFGLAGGLALAYEHAILHGVSHIVHSVLGYSALSYAASAATQMGVIVAQGVVCFAGSLVGPSLLALIKTAGGRCVRAISPSNKAAFQALAEDAQRELEDFRALTSEVADQMSNLQPQLSSFYARNEDVRALISSRLMSLSYQPDLISSGDVTELHKRSTALGASELITLMRCLNLEKKLRELSQADFRSPELVQATSVAPQGSSQVWGLSRGLRLTVRSFTSLFHSATTIGERSAINAARKSRDAFENLPQNPVTDILAGMGSGVSTTLEQALRAGTQPGKTTYSFLKGVIGLSKGLLVGGEKEGPRLETLLKVMFDLPELEKGNRIRFFSKLIPSLIRAATQKPIIMEQAQQVEELAGNVSPKGVETKLVERQGSYAVGKKMVKDLTSLVYSTSKEAVVRYGYVVPLDQISRSSIIRQTAPSVREWALQRLTAHDEKRHQSLQKKMHHELQQLSNAEELQQLQDNELDVYAIEKFIEYSYRPTPSISQREISALLHYWELRRKASWYEAADTQERHNTELAKLHPHFLSLRKILHVQSNLFSSVTRGLLFGKNTKSDEQLSPEEVLNASFTAWSTPLEGQARPTLPTILDASSDGMHVVLLDPHGVLHLLKAGQVRALFTTASTSAAPRLLEHADHARDTVCEMVLAMKLEPFQRRVLIDTHHVLCSGAISEQQACERLVKAGLPRGQLLTEDGRGILDSGLLGRRVPKDT